MKNTNESLNGCLSDFSHINGILSKAEINTIDAVYYSNEIIIVTGHDYLDVMAHFKK
jgi:hypothetical protein